MHVAIQDIPEAVIAVIAQILMNVQRPRPVAKTSPLLMNVPTVMEDTIVRAGMDLKPKESAFPQRVWTLMNVPRHPDCAEWAAAAIRWADTTVVVAPDTNLTVTPVWMWMNVPIHRPAVLHD